MRKRKPRDWTRAAMELPARMPDGIGRAPGDLLSAYQQIVLPVLERATIKIESATRIDEAVREMIAVELVVRQALEVIRP